MSRRPKLRELVSELESLQWSEVKRMAIQLGDCMKYALLKKIEEGRFSNEPNDWVTQAMDMWLKRDEAASWNKVVSALREVEMNTLAAKLEKKYCADISEPPYSHSGLQVLSHHNQSSTTPATIQSSSVPTLSRDSSPVGDRDSELTSTEIQDIIDETARLRKKFTSVIVHTKVCLVKKEKESGNFLTAFQVTLTSLQLFKQYKDNDFLKEKKSHIKGANDVDEIFDILEPYWNHVDYAFLEHIIKEFGNSRLKKEMRKYIAELEQFEKKTTVHDFSLATRKKIVSPDHYREMAVKLKKNPKKFTLHDVRQFKKSVENESTLESYTLLFRGVASSSVEIILAFPPEAYAKLSEVFKDENFKRKHEVISVVFREGTAASPPERRKSKGSSSHYKGEL